MRPDANQNQIRALGGQMRLALLAGDPERARALLNQVAGDVDSVAADCSLRELRIALAAFSDLWPEALEAWDWQLALHRMMD